MRGQLAAAAAIIATLGAAGCGGDDETLTAAQVREQGNAACLKLSQRLAKVDGDDLQRDPEGTTREIGSAVTQAMGTIRALHGPEAVQRRVDRFLALYDEGAELSSQMANPSMSDDRRDELRDQLNATSDRLERAARDAGFPACARL